MKFENTEVWGFGHALRGMRNPKNSWDKSDSKFNDYYDLSRGDVSENELKKVFPSAHIHHRTPDGYFADIIGANDMKLAQTLIKAGSEHRKFMRQIFVSVDITAPLYWWKEFDTYKVGTVANSCSTMHKIHAKEFTLNDFSHEHLNFDSIEMLELVLIGLNSYREEYLETKDKNYWWQLIQMLPSSYNQKRTVQLNYEVLNTIYHARKNHKLDEWHTLCDVIKELPYSEFITMDFKEGLNE